MPITPTTEIDIPAQPARTADKYWISSLTIAAPATDKKVVVQVQLIPYNSATGEMLPDRRKNLIIQDLFALAATDTDVAAACDAIYTAVDKIAKSKNLI